jgi:hypothetical protein
MSVINDLPVDTILEEAIMMWVETRSPAHVKRIDRMRALTQSATTREFLRKERLCG